MPNLPQSPAQFQLRLSGWKAIAVILAILTFSIAAIAVLAIGFFVIILPLIILAPVVYYFVPKLRPRRFTQTDAASQPMDSDMIIDGDFQVIDANAAKEVSERIGSETP